MLLEDFYEMLTLAAQSALFIAEIAENAELKKRKRIYRTQ